MVHRGHGVFDTAHVCDGRCHLLDRHLGELLLTFIASSLWTIRMTACFV
jgi:4-amino-4-deoxychorismate lyase